MIKIAPTPYLLLLPGICVLLGLWAIFLTGLSLVIQVGLVIALIAFAFFQSLSLIQIMPKSLVAFALPEPKHKVWELQLKKNLKRYEAQLLGSSRITSQIILLHFEVKNPKMRIYQIILPSMIGDDHFHDLLVYLKTH